MTGWHDKAAGDGGWLYEMSVSYVVDVVGIRKQQDLLTFARKEVLGDSLHVLRTKKDLKTFQFS